MHLEKHTVPRSRVSYPEVEMEDAKEEANSVGKVDVAVEKVEDAGKCLA